MVRIESTHQRVIVERASPISIYKKEQRQHLRNIKRTFVTATGSMVFYYLKNSPNGIDFVATLAILSIGRSVFKLFCNEINHTILTNPYNVLYRRRTVEQLGH